MWTPYLIRFEPRPGERRTWVRFAPSRLHAAFETLRALRQDYGKNIPLQVCEPIPAFPNLPTQFELACAGIPARTPYYGPFDESLAAGLLRDLRQPGINGEQVFDSVDLITQGNGYNLVYY